MTRAIDVHAYWDEKNLSLAGLQGQMELHGIERAILSAPCTLGSEPDKAPAMYWIQRLLLRSDFLRPTAQWISSSFYNRSGHLNSLWKIFTKKGKPIHKVSVPDNMALLSAIVGWENLFAWYWINPIRMPSRDEMQTALTHPRVVGIKIHAYWHCLDPDQAKPVFETAREWNLPIYLILNFGWDRKIETLLQTFPEVQVILGYAGFPYFDRIWKIVRSQNHVWVDLTSFHVDENIILAAIRQMGPERCLYGSDCPYNFRGSRGQFDYAKTLDRIQKLRLGSDKIDGILRGNAQHLLFDTAIAR